MVEGKESLWFFYSPPLLRLMFDTELLRGIFVQYWQYIQSLQCRFISNIFLTVKQKTYKFCTIFENLRVHDKFQVDVKHNPDAKLTPGLQCIVQFKQKLPRVKTLR